MHKSFFKTVFLSLTVLVLASCDKDFNEIGSDIVGEDHFGFEREANTTVVATNVATGAVESRNLPINPLGIYKSIFGTTTANFVTQVELSKEDPEIDEALDPQVTKVELYIPYFSTLTGTSENGNTYELDSVYGAPTVGFNLKIYESGYFLRDLDHSGEEVQAQLYYTDQDANIFDARVGDPLNNITGNNQNQNFMFSPSEHVETIQGEEGEEPTVIRTAPGMKIKLDTDRFQQKLIDAPASALVNNNAFKNHFRGLYFRCEQTNDVAALALLNFKAGKITVTYTQHTSTSDTTPVEKTLVLNLTGTTASLQHVEPSPAYADALAQPEEDNQRLWIKGGPGSVATIKLFGEDADGDDVPEELEEIREQNWMINEANLTFYIDQSAINNGVEPNRIYLYDLTNKRPILDYTVDQTTNRIPKFSKMVYGGIIEKSSNGRGVRYKIRITNYLNQLIKNADSTNVTLGLAVTETIGSTTMVKLRSSSETLNDYVPTTSVMSPLGTVLYGSSLNVPEDKRMKLEIFYTKPE